MRGEVDEGWTGGGGRGGRVIAADHAIQRRMKNTLSRYRKNKERGGGVSRHLVLIEGGGMAFLFCRFM